MTDQNLNQLSKVSSHYAHWRSHARGTCAALNIIGADIGWRYLSTLQRHGLNSSATCSFEDTIYDLGHSPWGMRQTEAEPTQAAQAVLDIDRSRINPNQRRKRLLMTAEHRDAALAYIDERLELVALALECKPRADRVRKEQRAWVKLRDRIAAAPTL